MEFLRNFRGILMKMVNNLRDYEITTIDVLMDKLNVIQPSEKCKFFSSGKFIEKVKFQT